MKTIHLHLALASLAAAMLVAGCGGGSSSTTSPTTTTAGKVTLTSTNAPDVAKGGMTPSQTTAKTGLGGAEAVTGVVVQPGAPRQSVMNIALAQVRRVQAIKVPAIQAGVVGASVSPFPITFGCGAYADTSSPVIPNVTTTLVSTSGTMLVDVQGDGTNGIFAAGNVATITFTNCVDAATTTNGSMSLAIDSVSVTVTSVTMSFANFSVVDTAPNPDETISMSGGITMAVSDNGTTLTATMSGSSFAATSSTDGSFTMKDFSIVAMGDSPLAAPTGNYSFSVTMTTNIASLSGDIDITTPTPFTGTGDNNPTAGVMVITGANGGTLTLTAQGNGTAVTVVLDTDGAGGSTAPQTLTSTTWDAI